MLTHYCKLQYMVGYRDPAEREGKAKTRKGMSKGRTRERRKGKRK